MVLNRTSGKTNRESGRIGAKASKRYSPIDACTNVNTTGQSVHTVGNVLNDVTPLAIAACLKFIQELPKFEFITLVVFDGSEAPQLTEQEIVMDEELTHRCLYQY